MKGGHLSLFAMIAVLPGFAFAQSELLEGFSPPETISIGNTTVLRVPAGASTERIQRLLDRAVDRCSDDHTVRLEFAPGADYRVGALEGKTVLRIERTKTGAVPVNLVIDGQGCTFTVTSWSRFLLISQARNVILKDFRLTYHPKNISQGVVTRVVDEGQGIYEVKIEPGYPLPDGPRFASAQHKWAIVMRQHSDGAWGMKPGCPTTISFKWPNSPTHQGDRRFRMRFHTTMDHGRIHGSHENDPLRRVVEVGDRVALLARTNGRGAFYATRCHTLVYRDIEVNHSPSSVFADQFSERTCYLGVTARATGGDLFTSTADGIFTTNQRNGPWIEGCQFQGIGDDAVVLKNTVGFFQGKSQDPARPYRIAAHKGWFSVLAADRLAVYDMRKRVLVSLHDVISVSSEQPWGEKDVALDPPLLTAARNDDLWIYNLSNQCNGFVLRGNTFTDHRRWGVLCSGADGSIVSNRFVRSQNAAIYLVNSDNYFDNKSGAVPRNVEIVGNRFEDCWHAENAHPFAVVAARMNGRIEVTRGEDEDADQKVDWNGIRNIRIERNHFERWDTASRIPLASRSPELAEHPVHAIFLRDVSDVRIVANEFTPSAEMAAGVYAIKLDDFRDVHIENNSFGNWPGGSNRAVSKTGESEDRPDAEQ
ncbi:MAG: right-handed parallel beta-helix repeat-containing protein [Kiritimatiellia bacterium]|jgi:hypothetical protein|nr:right-handed parallel beta-helix repeat-containing protein [Kiritimatiellia bacterium]